MIMFPLTIALHYSWSVPLSLWLPFLFALIKLCSSVVVVVCNWVFLSIADLRGLRPPLKNRLISATTKTRRPCWGHTDWLLPFTLPLLNGLKENTTAHNYNQLDGFWSLICIFNAEDSLSKRDKEGAMKRNSIAAATGKLKVVSH